MRARSRAAAAFAFGTALFTGATAAGQALTPPKGVVALTLGGQYVENIDHRLSDGNVASARGRSVTAAAFVEADYGLTERLAATVSLAYVFAKYTDPEPTPGVFLPLDSCRCWNSAIQDFTLSARYRLGDDPWSVTPGVRLVAPSHPYETKGEAVVGRNLHEFHVELAAALRLEAFLPRATVQAGYSYAFVEKVQGVPLDRTHGFFEVGYAATRRLYLHVDARWQRTHGGLRAGYLSGVPFSPPGEITPEFAAEHDRMLRDDYWHLGGGVGYSLGSFDVFASYGTFVSGTDTHDNRAWTAGLTYYFGGR